MELVFDSQGFHNLQEAAEKLQQKMQASYTLACSFRQKVEESTWEGQTKKEYLAFLDLILQYHAALHEDEGTAPMSFNATEIKNQANRIDAFLDSYPAFLALDE